MWRAPAGGSSGASRADGHHDRRETDRQFGRLQAQHEPMRTPRRDAHGQRIGNRPRRVPGVRLLERLDAVDPQREGRTAVDLDQRLGIRERDAAGRFGENERGIEPVGRVLAERHGLGIPRRPRVVQRGRHRIGRRHGRTSPSHGKRIAQFFALADQQLDSLFRIHGRPFRSHMDLAFLIFDRVQCQIAPRR